ncbi:ATPase-like protein [Rhexocercosporidium sp. MPI-PUGE-AT-0058]|nr:ATPase-like protein [Rhexocercosporidium sp. MPI-PUGE-AT-0058]
MMDFSGCNDDKSFGPVVHGCRDDFDFTIRFENIFFSLVPNTIFAILATLRILAIFRYPKLVHWRVLAGCKLAVSLILSAIYLALLVICTRSSTTNTVFTSSTAFPFVSALYIAALSALEHARSPRPSALIQIFLLLTILFDIARARTFWLAGISSEDFMFCRLFTASIVAKALVLLVESKQKSSQVQWDSKRHCPEETSGIFGLAAYTWLYSIFWNGYRTILTLEDLFALDPRLATENLQLKLRELLQDPSTKGKKHGLGLAKALSQTLLNSLLLPVVPRIGLIAFRFCQPFLINTLLDYLRKSDQESPDNFGYGLIGAAFLIYMGIALSTSCYWYLHERTLCKCRAALGGAIYLKTTEMRLSSSGDSAAVTLMSTDVERIRIGFLNLHEFWGNSVEVALASWLLQRQLGAAVAAPLIVVLCCVIGGTFANRYTGARQKIWMEKIQKRVGLTASVISNMKHLKISGLAAPVEALVQSMRVDELKAASRFRAVYVIAITFGFLPIALCPVMTFAVTSRTLDSTTIFTSMSYLLLLADPLSYIFQNTPNLLAAFTCLERIQKFLEQDPRNDYRIPRAEDRPTGGSSIDIESKFGSAVSITNGSFGWETNKMTLKKINLDIPTSQLTLVVGPVGSGKSTLCKTLLGEIPVIEGQVVIDTSTVSRRIGYCDQVPYLSNTSIKDNIIGFSGFIESRYADVIRATMLEADFTILPKGDDTIIGSDGISLSGGQKQRVSMARALYLDTNFFIFDDILSGLDADTEDQVFRRVFGPDGLIRSRHASCMLCTHTIRHLPSADHIVALTADGSIAEQGSFKELLSNEQYIHSLGISASDDRVSVGSTSTVTSKEIVKLEVQAVPDATTAPKEPGSGHMDEKKRMTGDSTVYKYYLGSLGKTSITAFIVFGLGWGFFYNWGNIWLQFWSKDVSSTQPSRSKSFYVGLYALFQMCYVGSVFFVFLICYRTMVLVSGSKLHKAALSTLITAPLSFFTSTDTGLVTNLFSQDMTLIDNELPIAVTNLALDLCNAIGMGAVIATASPWLALSYPVLFVILWGIQKFYLRTSRQLRFLDLEAKSPLYTHFLDTIKDVATFRAFGWVPDGIETNNRLLNTSQRPAYLLAMVQRWLLFTLQILVMLLAVGVVTLATQLRASSGFTGASLVTLMTFGDVLNYIIRWFTQIETSIGAVTRLKNFSQNVKPESLEGGNMIPPREWPVRGAIQIDGVSASYAGTENESGLAIKNLALSIRPGEKVAICGRSGSGKSSTILLLLRLLDPLSSCSGNIIIDDIHLRQIERSTLRERIIAIPQDPVFLPDGTSFMCNLDPFGKSNSEECQAVLEIVGLWPVIERRGGLESGMSVEMLSQGQKQLFSLARAVLRAKIRAREFASEFGAVSGDRPGGVLLLDEVSSNVDQETDRAMQRIIHEEFGSYTIVMVSHRLEMVMGFDTVVVMEKGSVVESGEPKVLVDTEGSRFKELWSLGKKG